MRFKHSLINYFIVEPRQVPRWPAEASSSGWPSLPPRSPRSKARFGHNLQVRPSLHLD
jgi:hypothetical protein